MSQIFDLRLTSNFMTKKGEDLAIFFYKRFSTFNKIKTRRSIKNLRHSSLNSSVLLPHSVLYH